MQDLNISFIKTFIILDGAKFCNFLFIKTFIFLDDAKF